jgi:toxin secretion/phage lysis holin
MEKGFDYIVALIMTGLTFLFGEFNGMLAALIAFIIIDYITGIVAAAFNKKLSSAKGAKGIAKKVAILLIVTLGHIIDVNIIGSGSYLQTMIILFYIANEGISIIENAHTLGLPIPAKLVEILEQIKQKSDDTPPEDGEKEDENEQKID